MDAGGAELLLKTAMKISISERNQGNEAYERIELPEPRSVRILFQYSRRGRRASVGDFLLRFSSRGEVFWPLGVTHASVAIGCGLEKFVARGYVYGRPWQRLQPPVPGDV